MHPSVSSCIHFERDMANCKSIEFNDSCSWYLNKILCWKHILNILRLLQTIFSVTFHPKTLSSRAQIHLSCSVWLAETPDWRVCLFSWHLADFPLLIPVFFRVTFLTEADSKLLLAEAEKESACVTHQSSQARMTDFKLSRDEFTKGTGSWQFLPPSAWNVIQLSALEGLRLS